jgi:hypothetical protein
MDTGPEMGRFFHVHKCEHKSKGHGRLKPVGFGSDAKELKHTPGSISSSKNSSV